jgi:hypothetical protein
LDKHDALTTNFRGHFRDQKGAGQMQSQSLQPTRTLVDGFDFGRTNSFINGGVASEFEDPLNVSRNGFQNLI